MASRPGLQVWQASHRAGLAELRPHQGSKNSRAECRAHCADPPRPTHLGRPRSGAGSATWASCSPTAAPRAGCPPPAAWTAAPCWSARRRPSALLSISFASAAARAGGEEMVAWVCTNSGGTATTPVCSATSPQVTPHHHAGLPQGCMRSHQPHSADATVSYCRQCRRLQGGAGQVG